MSLFVMMEFVVIAIMIICAYRLCGIAFCCIFIKGTDISKEMSRAKKLVVILISSLLFGLALWGFLPGIGHRTHAPGV